MTSENSAPEPPMGKDRQAKLRELGQRQTRFFAIFAIAEGAVLLGLALLTYVAELMTPSFGLGMMVAAVLIFGAVLVTKIMGFLRERAEITGKPGPSKG